MVEDGDKLLIFVFGLLVVALFSVYAASDVVRPYLQGGRVILRNTLLWVMFLACMGTSIFFSFDSFFTAIFPQSERVRAAELRAQNQVSGIIADIETVIGERNACGNGNPAAERCLDAVPEQSGTGFASIAATSQGALDRYINGQIEDRRRAVKEQQERMASPVGASGAVRQEGLAH